MSKTSKELAMRDPATAALVGVLPGEGDFGGEFDSYEFGTEFGTEFGDDFGDEIGAEAAALATPAGQSLVRKAKAAVSNAQRQQQRSLSMNPNAGLSMKIERYVFGLASTTAAPAWGATSTVTYSDQPKVRIRPQRLTINVPAEGVFEIDNISVSNVLVSIGNGSADAFMFSPRAFGVSLDLPAIDPSQRASVSGTWGTLVPPGYVPAASFPLTVAFIGPAHMAGK